MKILRTEGGDGVQEFGLMRYGDYKSWCITERHTLTRGKNKGKLSDWKEMKYPGTLEQAVEGLINLAIEANVNHTHLDSLLNAVEDAKQAVMEAMQ